MNNSVMVYLHNVELFCPEMNELQLYATFSCICIMNTSWKHNIEWKEMKVLLKDMYICDMLSKNQRNDKHKT